MNCPHDSLPEYCDICARETPAQQPPAQPAPTDNVLAFPKLPYWERIPQRRDNFGRRLCGLEECGNPHYSRNLCNMHWQAQRSGRINAETGEVLYKVDKPDLEITTIPNMGEVKDWIYIGGTEEYLNVSTFDRIKYNAAIKLSGKVVGTLMRAGKIKSYLGTEFKPTVESFTQHDEDEHQTEGRRYNMFNRSRMLQGTQEPVLKLPDPLLELFSCISDGNVDYLEKWLAFTVRRLGQPGCALILQGTHGTGKSAVGELLCTIFGPYGTVVSVREVESEFNSWLENKLFLFGEELSAAAVREKNRTMNILKKLVSGDSTTINRKGIAQYDYKNVSRWMIASNAEVPITMEQTERRFSILRSNKKVSSGTGEEISKNRRYYGQQLVSYLSTVDLEDFNNWEALDNEALRDLRNKNERIY